MPGFKTSQVSVQRQAASASEKKLGCRPPGFLCPDPGVNIHLWTRPPESHRRLPAPPGGTRSFRGPHPSLATRPGILAFLILWNVPSFWLTWPQALVVGMRQESACSPDRDTREGSCLPSCGPRRSGAACLSSPLQGSPRRTRGSSWVTLLSPPCLLFLEPRASTITSHYLGRGINRPL